MEGGGEPHTRSRQRNASKRMSALARQGVPRMCIHVMNGTVSRSMIAAEYANNPVQPCPLYIARMDMGNAIMARTTFRILKVSTTLQGDAAKEYGVVPSTVHWSNYARGSSPCQMAQGSIS